MPGARGSYRSRRFDRSIRERPATHSHSRPRERHERHARRRQSTDLSRHALRHGGDRHDDGSSRRAAVRGLVVRQTSSAKPLPASRRARDDSRRRARRPGRPVHLHAESPGAHRHRCAARLPAGQQSLRVEEGALRRARTRRGDAHPRHVARRSRRSDEVDGRAEPGGGGGALDHHLSRRHPQSRRQSAAVQERSVRRGN